MEAAKPNRKEVIMKTENPVHEKDFEWVIENATKFSRRLRSSNITLESECKPEFQLVAKFNDRYPSAHVTNVNIGIQRIDSGEETIHAIIDVQLLNSNGDQYCCKECDFTCSSGGAPFYVFSEMFSDSPSKLTLIKGATSYSSDDSHENLGLMVKRLLASHENLDKIFILPDDVLIVKGRLKIFGCCVVTNKVAVPDVPEKLSLQKHVNQLLWDIRFAYENEILTDVQLVSEGQTIKAHKFILQSRSVVFKRMFEHNTTEQNGTIEITDVDYLVLKSLVWYMYTGVVQKLPYEEVCDLYEAADKYDVFFLARECSEILQSFIGYDTVCRILVLASLHNDAALKEEAVGFIANNFAKVKVTEEWEMTIRAHQGIASDVLERVCQETLKKVSAK
ncbi:protein maternal effect lethal 26 [Nephila pilipes]|uniref:Protein maternal effect lethal 26 n=1 Tax=Nephila pilipes TaxID=299642 RepID=A0A8X6IN87_NEPPI|nr:protein maternal effect lethal 26 [Nephila pilipes]